MDLEEIFNFIPVLIAIVGLFVTFSGKKKKAEDEQPARSGWDSQKEAARREAPMKPQQKYPQSASTVRNKMAAERARDVLSKTGKARQGSASAGHGTHRAGSGKDTCEGAVLAGALRRTQGKAGLQTLSGSKPSEGAVVAAMIQNGVSQEKLKEAVIWSEILGQPMCRKRRQKARR